MIQYHIMSLLALAAAAFCAIEASVRFFGPPKELSQPLGWLMVALFGACIYLYFRLRKKRKVALHKRIDL
jgi:FtsH-binding integral membrane protein